MYAIVDDRGTQSRSHCGLCKPRRQQSGVQWIDDSADATVVASSKRSNRQCSTNRKGLLVVIGGFDKGLANDVRHPGEQTTGGHIGS